MAKTEQDLHYFRNLYLATAFSTVGHLIATLFLIHLANQPVSLDLGRQFSVKIVEDIKSPEPAKTIDEIPKAAVPVPVPVKKAIAKKQGKIRPASNKSPPATKKPQEVRPVQGLPPSDLAKDGPGLAVPIGNTLMDADKGQRIKPEEFKALPGEENGTQPQLIRSSIEDPGYSDEALDRGIEGTFTVVVYVDEEGVVTKAELKQKIGFGMDERVINAAKKVKFIPGKDPMGREAGQWTEIKFRLQIP